jgi:hypothetical protein
MGLLGLIVVMFLQLFFFSDSSTASLVIGILGVVIFTGLTAWDVQRLKNGAMPNINKDSATVLGALALYLDFINLFFMLRISAAVLTASGASHPAAIAPRASRSRRGLVSIATTAARPSEAAVASSSD